MYDDYDDDQPVMLSEDAKYPEIEVQLIGREPQGFSIMSRVRTALHKGGVSKEELKEFMDEAMSGDYNHVIQTAMRWVTVY